MRRGKIPVVLVTDHRLTNKNLSSGIDPSKFEVHVLESDDPRLLPQLCQIRPALIFVRKTLSAGSGFELCNRIKARAELAYAQVVFLSQDETSVDAAFENQACHFLRIPFSRADVERTVDEVLKFRPVILFVDDSSIVHETIVPKLAADGYEIIEAWDGDEALEILSCNRVDLVITDIEMPNRNGFALCEAIKNGDSDQTIPVLLMSSLHSENEISKGFDSGADDYIVKPIVLVELLSRVQRLLPGHRPKRPERILVVDDSVTSRKMIKQSLEAQGLQVHVAESVQEATEMIGRMGFHLVVTDYEMPVQSGYDLCMKIRDDGMTADLPIVMVSARESRADEVRVRSAGIQAFILKPFKSERLVAEVERVLAEYRLLRQRKTTRLYLSDTAAAAVDRLSADVGSAVTTARDEYRTILFTDICGFTPLCEKMPARSVVQLLNSYFDGMVEKLLKYDATIDKFIGDAIMALFDHHAEGAQRAICASLEMIESLAGLRERTGIDLHIRIGINSGYVVMGDLGSDSRRDFTVIGDNVNVAQRLESAAGRDEILISESTFQLVQNYVDVVPTQPFHIKGKADPVQGFIVKSHQPKLAGRFQVAGRSALD